MISVALLPWLIVATMATANEPNIPYLTSECETLSLIDGIVNAHNGQIVQQHQDITMGGIDPIEVKRYYDGGHHFNSTIGYGFGLSFPTLLIFDPMNANHQIAVEQRMGSDLLFRVERTRREESWHYTGTLAPQFYRYGYTNSTTLLNGAPAPALMSVAGGGKQFKVSVGNGNCRYYSRFNIDIASGRSAYRLTLEELPSGNRRHYSYSNESDTQLSHIWTTNKDNSLTINWLDFTYDDYTVTLTASNGQTAHYSLTPKKGTAKNNKWSEKYTVNYNNQILNEVTTTCQPTVTYDFTTRTLFNNAIFGIKEVKQPLGRNVRVAFNPAQRVYSLFNGDASKPFYTFRYYRGYNSVIDALGETKQYRYYNKMLREVREGHRVHHFDWSKKGELLLHTLSSPLQTLISARRYSYDSDGNMIATTISGAITEKGALDNYTVRYAYSDDNHHNLIQESHPSGLEYRYSYLPNSNLVTKKVTQVDGNTIESASFDYDANGILIQKVVARNGSTLVTTITPQLDPSLPGMTQPREVIESYIDKATGQHMQLLRSEYIYTQGDLIGEKRVYDAEDHYCYSLTYQYDAHRRCISESNPLGETTQYRYNANNQKVYEEKGGKKCHYLYDSANNLIQEEYIYSHGESVTLQHSYDLMGNRTETKKSSGEETRYLYDTQSRLMATIDSLGRKEQRSHDKLGHANTIIDPDGHATTTINNIYGSPLQIDYPDGTRKSFVYNIQGILIKERQVDGSYTTYTVDYQGRPLVTTLHAADGTPLSSIQKRYAGDLLIEEVDTMGHTTSYQYDGAGRCIEKRQGNSLITYSYDSLGRLAITHHHDHCIVQQYDLMGRVIEERVEDRAGSILSKVQYRYDSDGNLCHEKRYSDAINFTQKATQYDGAGRPISITDSQTGTTTIHYRRRSHLEKESVDVLGRKQVDHFDACGQLQRCQHYDPQGQLISDTTFSYDGRGNMIRQEEARLLNGQRLGSYLITMKYDAMGQKVEQTEQGRRTTRYSYVKGKLNTLTLPDGITLNYSYDTAGRLAALRASDGSIAYSYSYDCNGNIICAEDCKRQLKTERQYDAHNRLIYEKQMTGLAFSYHYDSVGRLKEMDFVDGTLVYNYAANSLVSISRYQGNRHLYTYHQKADWAGKLKAATLPNGTQVTYSWDPGGQCTEINSAHYQQVFNYDPVGNLITTTIEDAEGQSIASYKYDAKNRLIKEDGPFIYSYTYDSLGNCCEKNGVALVVDALNQLIYDGKNCYTYDRNGRRITQNGARYQYDALGRLIAYSDDHHAISYSYDPFGRRMERRSEERTTSFLYHHGSEIGAYEEGRLVQFAALHEKQSPVAIELDGAVYSPVRNHRGDICMLLDSKKVPVITYRYNAFGFAASLGATPSPWLLSGQRYDSATALYHCERREYDPATERWLTPDPRGFVEGPNLYTYVKNNPFIEVSVYDAASDLFFKSSPVNDKSCFLLSSHVGYGTAQFKVQWINTKERL